MAGTPLRFTAGSSAWSAAQKVPIDPGSGGAANSSTAGDQVVGIFAIGNHASGAAAAYLAWIDTVNNLVLWTEAVTIAATANKVNPDNSATTQGYQCSVSCAASLSRKADVLGVGNYADQRAAAVALPNAKIELFFGVTTLTNFTTLDVYVMPTRTI